MRISRSALVLISVAMFSSAVRAAFRPSFGGDAEAWRSTDIVLVSALPTDGTFEVIEAWKGSLRVRARIVVPPLIPEPDSVPISRYPTSTTDAFRSTVAQLIPRQPAGSHMVLFLKRNPSSSEKSQWEPANSMDSMKASVVWIEGGELYSFIQVMNPGPSILQPMTSYSLQTLKERVAQVTRTQEEMSSVLAMPAGGQRAQSLKLYAHSDVLYARLLAFQELGKSGPMAVPTIREMLDDPTYTEQAPELIEAMVNAGGAAVGTDLNRRFQREVAFWESTGPSLSSGWWNKNAEPNAPLRLQYSLTYQLIISLQKTLNKDALAPAKQLHDLWVSYPQLNDPSGLNQISLECEKLITMLESN